MTTTGGILTELKQPEYVGENRCMPCTVVNTLIAGAVSVVVGVGVATASSPAAGVGAGLVVFGLSLAAIYLRGYLVPGTPTLTKRYFPEWLLQLFGKEPEEMPEPGQAEVDPEQVLTSIGALEECADGTDLCLTDGFREEWDEEIQRLEAEDADREQLLRMLDTEEGEVSYEEYGAAFRAFVDDQPVGKWESRGAFLADLGAANVLARWYSDWDRLSLPGRSQLLSGMRLFIDTCPECGGVPEFGAETVESCCSTYEVAAVSCTDCGARLFETRAV
ncbi:MULTISPECIES: hypothetical protein [Salinibaculum]|uniref:hypothetical protein n=1 Tax=Salinibaculum TaxID=2732368 RepID=UPI0030CFC4D1